LRGLFSAASVVTFMHACRAAGRALELCVVEGLGLRWSCPCCTRICLTQSPSLLTPAGVGRRAGCRHKPRPGPFPSGSVRPTGTVRYCRLLESVCTSMGVCAQGVGGNLKRLHSSFPILFRARLRQLEPRRVAGQLQVPRGASPRATPSSVHMCTSSVAVLVAPSSTQLVRAMYPSAFACQIRPSQPEGTCEGHSTASAGHCSCGSMAGVCRKDNRFDHCIG
jgi:hypothetical protein